MEKDKKIKIAKIIESFGKINQDIISAFDAMKSCMEKRKYNKNKWKKNEPGKKNTTDGYYDFKGFLDGTNKFYYLNHYGELDGKVIGFTFIISVDYDEDEDKNYALFLEELDKNLIKTAPMLCILGIYEPIQKLRIVDDDGWNYVDQIIRRVELNDESIAENDPKDISYRKWFTNKTIKTKDDKGEIMDGYKGWFETADVMIIQIADISSESDAEKLIQELFEKAKENSIKDKQ